jgi:uncharacterized RDD family membrane protein YckC
MITNKENTTMITQPAGFWIRLLANILDAIIISLPITIISYLLTSSWNENVYTNVINIAYALVIPVLWYGYTVGKKIAGIRIAKVNGEKIGFGTMALRVIVAALVYVITIGIGVIVSILMVIFRKDKRSLHDFIAGTFVTYEKPDQTSNTQTN